MNGRVEMPEAEALVQGYLEGSLSDQESARLRLLLRQDASTVDQILAGLRDEMLIRAVLAEGMVAAPAWTATEWRPVSPLPGWWGALVGRLRGHVWACGVVGVAALVVIGLWLSGFGLQMGEPVLTQVEGAGLTLERDGRPVQVRVGTRLQAGDRLRTADSAVATLTFAPENTHLTLQPGTGIKIAPSSRGKRFELLLGRLEASVARQRPFRPMLVQTPQAEARVLGTKFTLTVSPTTTRLDVMEGKVRFTRLSDGTHLEITKDHYSLAGTNADLGALPQTGRILHEYWTNVPGNTTDPLLELAKDRRRFPAHPDQSELLERLEASAGGLDNFADRFRGYVHPPSSGDYIFSLTTSDASRLLLSPSEAPGDAIPIATTDVMQGSKPLTQQSVALTLTAGRCYYIEVIRYGGKGSHELAVSWQPPGYATEIISGRFLSPFKLPNQKGSQP